MSTPLPLPMLATAYEHVPHDDAEWACEMKWDGYRAIVGIEGGRLRIASRRGNDVTARYPELDGLAAAVGVDSILDGELVVLDAAGHASFQEIQNHEAPAVFVCFDVLMLDGRDTTSLPWRDRRALLERLALSGDRWQTSPAPIGDAARVLAAAEDLGFEGVVCKHVDSPYLPGRRSTSWRKVKLTKRQELVIGGWLPGVGRLANTLGSVLVGHHDGVGGPLRYAGRVGTGFDDRGRDALAQRLVRRSTSPFDPIPRVKGAIWVEPDCVAEVKFTEWTTEGVLRQPVFLALRDDKDPNEVVREEES